MSTLERLGDCLTCGHPRNRHFTPIVTAKEPLDSPCPCYFLVDGEPCNCTAAVAPRPPVE